MSSDPHNEPTPFEARTRELFDTSVESLDGRTRSRLTQARHAAAEELSRQRAHPWRRSWIATSSATAAAFLAVWIGVRSLGPAPETRELPFDEWEIVAESPNFDLLRDVEFYAWVAEQPASADLPSG